MSREHGAQRQDAEGVAPGTAAAGKRSLVASRYPTLAQAMGDRGGAAGAPTIHDAATAAVERKGAGAPVDPGVVDRVGAHLGADFAGVRVHADPLAQEASAAMGARAFAHGADVFLGPGARGDDLALMAHELTHVAQQGAAGQRALARKVAVGDADTPAEHQADQVAAEVTSGEGQPAAMLVDDGPVGPGQMLKSQFLEQLRAQVRDAADAELGPVRAAIGCPPIDQYFDRLACQPASMSEQLLRRFAPASRAARTAPEMIPTVVARVRESVRQWRDTGQAPPELAAMTPAAGHGGAPSSAPARAQALRAPDGRETLASLEAELGPGQPLDGTTAHRMSDALRMNASAARLHTGPIAARKAADVGALAFAVGNNIVMGASAPVAGTLMGDALLAHELAHTAQQAEVAADPAARQQPLDAESATAEDHADVAAASAVAQLYGGQRSGLLQRLGGAFKTSLRLQRCDLFQAPSEQTRAEAADLLPSLETAINAGQWEVIRAGVNDVPYAEHASQFLARRTGGVTDLTGIGSVVSVEGIATAVRTLQSEWTGRIPEDRVTALEGLANNALTAVHIPRLLDAEPNDSTVRSARAAFASHDWRLLLNPELLETESLTDTDAAGLANSVAHELRHADQAFLVARLIASQGRSEAQIAGEAHIPQEIASAALEAPLQSTDARYDEAWRMRSSTGEEPNRGPENQGIALRLQAAIDELDTRRAAAESARDALHGNAVRSTIDEAIQARDLLSAQTETVRQAYLDYRAIPHEADAYEVGDSAEAAFRNPRR